MLTAAKLDEMTAQDRTETWRKMCVDLHGNGSYRAAVARDMGITPQTIFRWERENAVPHMALMLVENWLTRKQLCDLKSAFPAMEKLADWLG